MTARLGIGRDALISFLVFIAVSVGLCLAWKKVDHAYGRAVAPALARTVERVSVDVVYVDHNERGDPILVLENNKRRPVARAMPKVAGYTLPVFLSLIVAGFAATKLRGRLTGRSGILRMSLGLLGLLLYHGLAAVTLVSYAVSVENRGHVERSLRLAGSFVNVAQPFVPFVLFALVLLAWRPSKER